MAHDFASSRGRSQKKRSSKAKKNSLPTPSLGTILSVLALCGFGFGLYFLSGVTPEDNTAITPKTTKDQPAIPAPIQERLATEEKNPEPTYTFYEKLKKMQSWEPGERVEIRKPKETKEKDTQSTASSLSENSKKTNPSYNTSTASKPMAGTSPAAGKKYILQAGSYRSFEDANNQRVKLIINGVRNTRIDTVTLADGKVSHRIEVGPFSSQQEVQNVKQQLANLKVSSFSRTVK